MSGSEVEAHSRDAPIIPTRVRVKEGTTKDRTKRLELRKVYIIVITKSLALVLLVDTIIVDSTDCCFLYLREGDSNKGRRCRSLHHITGREKDFDRKCENLGDDDA